MKDCRALNYRLWISQVVYLCFYLLSQREDRPLEIFVFFFFFSWWWSSKHSLTLQPGTLIKSFVVWVIFGKITVDDPLTCLYPVTGYPEPCTRIVPTFRSSTSFSFSLYPSLTHILWYLFLLSHSSNFVFLLLLLTHIASPSPKLAKPKSCNFHKILKKYSPSALHSMCSSLKLTGFSVGEIGFGNTRVVRWNFDWKPFRIGKSSLTVLVQMLFWRG